MENLEPEFASFQIPDIFYKDSLILDEYSKNEPKGNLGGGGLSYCIDFYIQDSICSNIIGYSNALDGFASFGNESFSRMFYLSAITITTLGFGDIVPLTNRSRLIVSIEAIWGIILVGLFLNSLAEKISSKK